MLSKAILGSLIALAVGGAVGEPVHAQYSPYQSPNPSQYSPYQSPYPSQNSPYQATDPSQSQYPAQPQYAPAQQPQYSQPQYSQPQYAPAQTGYPQMPADCMQNNTAAGAATGGAVGGLIGGIAGGGRGALIGGLAGTVFGGLSGAQADEQCQQLAVQIAYQQAAAQAAAYQQQVAQQAAQQSGALDLPAAAYVPVSADYQTPSNHHRHRVTVKRLNSYSDPATRQVCDNFTKIDVDFDGNTSSTANARRCKGSDGQWHDT
jgi:type II secretory pathway pseudopilin PulG